MPKDPYNPSDGELFRQTVGDARRLTQDRTLPFRRAHSPYPQSRNTFGSTVSLPLERDEQWLGVQQEERVEFRRQGLQLRAIKRLRQGYYPIEGHLDLHGKTARDAQRELSRFLGICHQKGWQCVRIVHGKGISSPEGQPVLKNRMVDWLRERPDVNAFCSAPRSDGGTGAVCVLIRARYRGILG